MVNTKVVRDPEQELVNCNFAKTILTGLVVLYHSMCIWRSDGWFNQPPAIESYILGKIADFLNTFHVYAFTLISGYVYYYLRYEKEKGYKDFKAFLWNKVERLLIPYIFVSMFWIIPFQTYFFEVNIKSVFLNFVVAINPSQLWYMVMLFGVFFLFWFLSDYIREHDGKGALLLSTIYVLSFVLSRLVPNIFQIISICKHLLFFWLGFKLRQKKDLQIRKIPVYLWVLADLAIFCVVNIVNTYNTNIFTKVLLVGGNIVLNLIGALMAFFVLQYIADKWKGWRRNYIFSWLSKNNMIIYMLHQQLIYLTISWFNGRIPNMCLLFLNFSFSICASIVITWCMGKTSFTRKLLSIK